MFIFVTRFMSMTSLSSSPVSLPCCTVSMFLLLQGSCLLPPCPPLLLSILLYCTVYCVLIHVYCCYKVPVYGLSLLLSCSSILLYCICVYSCYLLQGSCLWLLYTVPMFSIVTRFLSMVVVLYLYIYVIYC